jgi:hypothetical protein
MPSTLALVYTGPVTISSSATVQAIAVATGYPSSAAASLSLVFPTAATPTFCPAGNVHFCTDRGNLRYHSGCHHLLHHRRNQADHQFDRLYGPYHGIEFKDHPGYCSSQRLFDQCSCHSSVHLEPAPSGLFHDDVIFVAHHYGGPEQFLHRLVDASEWF